MESYISSDIDKLMRLFEQCNKNEWDFFYLCSCIRCFFEPLDVDINVKLNDENPYSLVVCLNIEGIL